MYVATRIHYLQLDTVKEISQERDMQVTLAFSSEINYKLRKGSHDTIYGWNHKAKIIYKSTNYYYKLLHL